MPSRPGLDEWEKRRLVRDGYDAIAGHYLAQVVAGDAPDAPRRRWTAAVLARLTAPARVLELGCGAGVPVGRLVLDAGLAYTGVDLSSRQIDLARRHLPEATLVCGDIAELDFARGSCDAIVMLFVITHVPRDGWLTLFRRMAQWLTPGGPLLVNVPLEGVESWLEEDFLGSGRTNWTNGHDLDVTEDLMARAGLRVEQRELIPENEGSDSAWMWLLAATGAP